MGVGVNKRREGSMLRVEEAADAKPEVGGSRAGITSQERSPHPWRVRRTVVGAAPGKAGKGQSIRPNWPE